MITRNYKNSLNKHENISSFNTQSDTLSRNKRKIKISRSKLNDFQNRNVALKRFIPPQQFNEKVLFLSDKFPFSKYWDFFITLRENDKISKVIILSFRKSYQKIRLKLWVIVQGHMIIIKLCLITLRIAEMIVEKP